MEGLPGTEPVAAANGFALAFGGAPKENAGAGFVADVGVCPNVKADVGRLSSFPKLNDVLIGGAWGAPNPPNGLLSAGFLAVKGLEVVDETPNAKAVDGAVDPLDVPPNKVLPFCPFDVALANENGALGAFPFICISLTGLSSILTS